MTIDIFNPKHIIADEGKILKCLQCNRILGTEVWLGLHLIDGIEVEDTADNYIEIDNPHPLINLENNELI